MGEQKLTPSLRDTLEWYERAAKSEAGCILMLTVKASGTQELTKLRKALNAGWLEYCTHPSIVDGDRPASAVRLTEAGRVILKR